MRFGADTGSGVDSERPSPEAVARWAGEGIFVRAVGAGASADPPPQSGGWPAERAQAPGEPFVRPGEFAKCRLARRSGRAGLGNGFDPVDEVIGGA